mgnify:CR=1 FL=1
MTGPLHGEVLVGTASWTDPEFVKAGWYPPDVKADADARLRYYAERFPMVEVNSTFYAIPRPETCAAWAERTPPGFRFHVKAHQVVSGHPSDPSRLPPALREMPFTPDARGRIRRPSRTLRDAAIDALLEAVGPLGPKLGAVLVQLPPFVTSKPETRREQDRIQERIAPARAAVEFRHRTWASDALAYLRLHGRNGETWTKGRSVAERFDWVYSEAEMGEWLDPVLDMAERAQEVAVVFNNNARDYALRNAQQFRELIAARTAGRARAGG